MGLPVAALEGLLTVCEALLDAGAAIDPRNPRSGTSIAVIAARRRGGPVRLVFGLGTHSRTSTQEAEFTYQ